MDSAGEGASYTADSARAFVRDDLPMVTSDRQPACWTALRLCPCQPALSSCLQPWASWLRLARAAESLTKSGLLASRQSRQTNLLTGVGSRHQMQSCVIGHVLMANDLIR